MNEPDLNKTQWAFLAVLDALGGPVSITTAETLAPISPSDLLQLIRYGQTHDLFTKSEQDTFQLSATFPETSSRKLKEINTPKRLTAVVGKLKALDKWESVPLDRRLILLTRSGSEKEAAILKVETALAPVDETRRDVAFEHLAQGLETLARYLGDKKTDRLFTDGMKRVYYLDPGKGLHQVPLLELSGKCIEAANRLGDQRSAAFFNILYGRFLELDGRFPEAAVCLKKGETAAKASGDKESLLLAAISRGYHLIETGRHREAFELLENAGWPLPLGQVPLDLIMLYVFSALISGFYARGLGSLDYYLSCAGQLGMASVAAHFQSTRGIFLMKMNQLEKAKRVLTEAFSASKATGNLLSECWAEIGLCQVALHENRIPDAWQFMDSITSKLGGLVSPAPEILSGGIEVLYMLEQTGYSPPKGFGFQDIAAHNLNSKNIYRKGLTLRLLAMEARRLKKPQEKIQAYLSDSRQFLETAGAQVELAQTRIESARLELDQGNRTVARALLIDARFSLSGFHDHLFPDDLRHLVEKDTGDTTPRLPVESILEALEDELSNLQMTKGLDAALVSTISITNRLFRAERGAVFWSTDKKTDRLKARAFRNMTETDVSSRDFQSIGKIIDTCRRENRPKQISEFQGKPPEEGRLAKSILCLPLSIQGRVRGVLYHENAYTTSDFTRMDKQQLVKVAKKLSWQIDRTLEISSLLEKTRQITATEATRPEVSGHREVAPESPAMLKILKDADQVAPTDSTVLIQGETGVGKELLAARIHRTSRRAEGPFITVDPTTIPETLVESELFGHEKGAFTGADRRKIGRVELAHNGTLFIDEVGEMPPATQVKLLRVLQEKAFIRVGGLTQVSSNFRLIAATNRDLATEVQRGRFRSDLYYRLNTVPLTIPPLRVRFEDIMMLARHFLARFGKKYQKPGLSIRPADEGTLTAYHWPGNVRELENIMERAVILSEDRQLVLNLSSTLNTPAPDASTEFESLDELNRNHIQQVLTSTRGKLFGPDGAAEILKVNPQTLRSKMRKLGIQKPKRRPGRRRS
ncbi:MAG: sigma-54-dependent Fis family transcriptional regulator [Deltaproteobacteria bacterium]|nr:sigma-54-dependent Fis family transcriptional regulator [Deltaproteobacteria bacterium]